MTRAELIAHIEAGETGHALDVQIARMAIPNDVRVPAYTTSIDAAVGLLGSASWAMDSCGYVTIDRRFCAYSLAGPAAATSAAWLKATAGGRGR